MLQHPGAGAYSIASSGVDPGLDRHVVLPGQASRSSAPPSAVGALGLAVSLRGFFQDQLIDGQIRHGSLQAAVFPFQFLEAFGLIDLQAAALIAPPIVGLLSDT